MTKDEKDISIVILCYKAGENTYDIVSTAKKVLEEENLNYELVLVGNYNKGEENVDKTPKIVNSLALNDDTIKPVVGLKRGMYGWDVRDGLSVATGKTIGFIDGDGQFPMEDIIRVYRILKEKDVDMVQTFRVKRFDGNKRIFVSKVYNFLLKILFPKVSVYDANSKPKLFKKEAFKLLDLHSNDWFIDAEIVIQASKNNFKIAQIPTTFFEIEYRRSFVKFATLFEFFLNLVHYRVYGKVRS